MATLCCLLGLSCHGLYALTSPVLKLSSGVIKAALLQSVQFKTQQETNIETATNPNLSEGILTPLVWELKVCKEWQVVGGRNVGGNLGQLPHVPSGG